MKGVYRSIYPDFTKLQDFTQRMSDLITIINIQVIDSQFHIFYYSTSELKKD
jgi:hypothetical protein